MSRISQTSIYWVAGHLIVFLVGILLVSAPQLTSIFNEQIGQAVGGSLIAAGAAGEIMFLYVRASESMQERFDIYQKAGLLKVFAHRSVRIKDEYHERLRNVHELDVIGFGLSEVVPLPETAG